jgi:hypothetical protein
MIDSELMSTIYKADNLPEIVSFMAPLKQRNKELFVIHGLAILKDIGKSSQKKSFSP